LKYIFKKFLNFFKKKPIPCIAPLILVILLFSLPWVSEWCGSC